MQWTSIPISTFLTSYFRFRCNYKINLIFDMLSQALHAYKISLNILKLIELLGANMNLIDLSLFF